MSGYVNSNYIQITKGLKPFPCADCGSTVDVKTVKPRRSWGAAGQTYYPSTSWCLKCRKKHNGAYCLVGGKNDA
jgi:hypothetical protein